jgi:hypothetical protein
MPADPRNGLPDSKPYVYRGLGYGTRTGPDVLIAEAAERRRSRPPSSAPSVTALEVAEAVLGRLAGAA